MFDVVLIRLSIRRNDQGGGKPASRFALLSSRITGAGKVLLLSAILTGASCSPPPPPPPPEPPPEVTPHPATGAKETAVKMYPALAVKGSTFNQTFLEIFEDNRKKNSFLLTDAQWPITLANQTARILGVKPWTPPPPKATPTPVALERGAYDKRGFYTTTPRPYPQ